MQNWFFLEKGYVIECEESPEPAAEPYPPQLISWLFRVRAPNLLPGEVVCVTGNVDCLGKWAPEKCVPLTQQEGDKGIWSQELKVYDDADVEYRYCICLIIENGKGVIVRKWETNLRPRRIRMSDLSLLSSQLDEFGEYEVSNRVESGWLTENCVVQLKLFKNALTMWKSRFLNRTLYVKVTPVDLSQKCNDTLTRTSDIVTESHSTHPLNLMEAPKYAHTVVANVNALNNTFAEQGKFGKKYSANDLLIFETSLLDLKNITFFFDLYVYSSRASGCEPPYRLGFTYLLPSALSSSQGHIVLPVTSVRHEPLGQLELEYLVIKPLRNYRCDMRVSYARHWKYSCFGLDVGHRGLGTSFKIKTKNCTEVLENTIASLKTAVSHGADFVEFDVQLSKDFVPIIYHDFYVCISMKSEKHLNQSDILQLPVKDLTLEQLHMLKVYHLSEGKARDPRYFDENLDDHQPFPTLQQALQVLEPQVGFNIEIKWSSQLNDGTNELDHSFDINAYLDTILGVVLQFSGQRRIIFSCFNPDVCRIIRLKQNKYPVMFITQGKTERYPNFSDSRCHTVEAAVQFALCMNLLGINVHTQDLLRDKSLVRLALDAGLIVFCWGDDNNNLATIRHMKELGLHAIIYDKVDQNTSKEVLSIFLVEANESQHQMLLETSANIEETISPPQLFCERNLEVEYARQKLIDISTATSIESIQSQPLEKDTISNDQQEISDLFSTLS